MAIAKATKAQRYEAYRQANLLIQELQQYVQGLNRKASNAAYNTAVDALIDANITALTALKNAA